MMCLVDYLESQGNFDSKEVLDKKYNLFNHFYPYRLKIVNLLEDLAKRWVISQCVNSEICNEDSSKNEEFAKICLQGSAVIGASTRNSDIDAVLVVPNFISNDLFFDSLTDKIKSISKLEKVLVVKGAWIPLIRLIIDSIKIDLVFCRLSTDRIPKNIDFTIDPFILYKDMEHNSIQLLSGVHLSHEIQNLVPDHARFLQLLKAVKLWATRRKICDFIYGFPPSISWALLCVYVCRQFDSILESLEMLLKVFFTYYGNWNWQENPLLINSNFENLERFTRGPKQWMYIISPVYPYTNTTMSVRRGTFEIIKREILRARDTLLPVPGTLTEDVLSILYESYDIRNDFRYFIKISLFSSNEYELDCAAGLVNSRLRGLAQSLEEELIVSHTRIIKIPYNDNNKFLDQITIAKCHEDGKECVDLNGSNNLNDSDNNSEYIFKHWLIGVDILKTNGRNQKRELNISPHLNQFYRQLSERYPQTPYNVKMNVLFLKKNQLDKLFL